MFTFLFDRHVGGLPTFCTYPSHPHTLPSPSIPDQQLPFAPLSPSPTAWPFASLDPVVSSEAPPPSPDRDHNPLSTAACIRRADLKAKSRRPPDRLLAPDPSKAQSVLQPIP